MTLTTHQIRKAEPLKTYVLLLNHRFAVAIALSTAYLTVKRRG